MAKKQKLVLHIGSHKTGTTTIQTTLHDNAEHLRRQGISFACVPPYANLHHALGFVTPSNVVPRGSHVTNAEALTQALTQVSEQTVIASSENLSFFFERASIEGLRDLLCAHFEQVQILVYLRRQDSHAISHHQEGSKPARKAEEQLFGYAPTALPQTGEAMDLYLDYEHRIGMWIDVFGAPNVTVQVFDRARLEGGDVFEDFLKVVGIDGAAMPQAKERNVSLSFSQAAVGHMMNARKITQPRKEQILQALPEGARMMPARAEAEAFYDRYRAGNIRLNERLGGPAGADLFSDDFSDYPEIAQEHWDHDTSAQVINSLLDQVVFYEQLVRADALLDSALLAHKAGNGKLALELIRAAATLRPAGPFIVKKREEFEALYGAKDAQTPG